MIRYNDCERERRRVCMRVWERERESVCICKRKRVWFPTWPIPLWCIMQYLFLLSLTLFFSLCRVVFIFTSCLGWKVHQNKKCTKTRSVPRGPPSTNNQQRRKREGTTGSACRWESGPEHHLRVTKKAKEDMQVMVLTLSASPKCLLLFLLLLFLLFLLFLPQQSLRSSIGKQTERQTRGGGWELVFFFLFCLLSIWDLFEYYLLQFLCHASNVEHNKHGKWLLQIIVFLSIWTTNWTYQGPTQQPSLLNQQPSLLAHLFHSLLPYHHITSNLHTKEKE